MWPSRRKRGDEKRVYFLSSFFPGRLRYKEEEEQREEKGERELRIKRFEARYWQWLDTPEHPEDLSRPLFPLRGRLLLLFLLFLLLHLLLFVFLSFTIKNHVHVFTRLAGMTIIIFVVKNASTCIFKQFKSLQRVRGSFFWLLISR